MKKGKLNTRINKQLSIIVVPHSSQKIKSVLLPQPALIIYSIAALTVVLVITAIIMQNVRLKSAVRDFTVYRTSLESYTLDKEQEIEKLKSDKEEQQKSIEDIQKKLKDMTELETRIRSMLEPSRGRSDAASRSSTQVKDMELLIKDAALLFDEMYELGVNVEKLSAGSMVLTSPEAAAELSKMLEAAGRYSEARPDYWPIQGTRVTSDFGYRLDPVEYITKSHTGLDLAADYGDPVHAAAKGTVTYSGWLDTYGYLVIIDHGYSFSTRYGHNSRLLVDVGDKVEKGEKIALAGSTGKSTGPHLHFEVRLNNTPVNPLSYLAAD